MTDNPFGSSEGSGDSNSDASKNTQSHESAQQSQPAASVGKESSGNNLGPAPGSADADLYGGNSLDTASQHYEQRAASYGHASTAGKEQQPQWHPSGTSLGIKGQHSGQKISTRTQYRPMPEKIHPRLPTLAKQQHVQFNEAASGPAPGKPFLSSQQDPSTIQIPVSSHTKRTPYQPEGSQTVPPLPAHQRLELPKKVIFSHLSSPLQLASVPEDDDAVTDSDWEDVQGIRAADPFNSPPLRPSRPSMEPVSRISTAESDGGLYMVNSTFSSPQEPNPPSPGRSSWFRKGNSNSSNNDRSGGSSTVSTPRHAPKAGSIPNVSLDPSELERSEPRGAPNGTSPSPVAHTNFDANYLATLGRDTAHINIHVDNYKRARNLLRRLEGRSGPTGLFGTLFRLSSTMASEGEREQRAKRRGESRSARIKKKAKEANVRLKSAKQRSMSSIQGALSSTSPLSGIRRRGSPKASASDNSLLATFAQPQRAKPKPGARQDRELRRRPAAMSKSEPATPQNGAEPAHSESPPNGRAEAEGARELRRRMVFPRNVSSARISAVMMTPEAFARTGVIPPPSAQSSLRKDESFTSSYFDLEKKAYTPTSSPLGSAAVDSERAQLIEKITAILEKQDFIMHLARAWHAFGAPIHRMEPNLLEVARYLEIDACFFSVPGLTLVSFGDSDTHSSETHIVRASSNYDLYRLERSNIISRSLRKGNATVHESIREIEELLAAPQLLPWWAVLCFLTVQTFFLTMTLFHGSWREAGIACAMGFVVSGLEILSAQWTTLGYILNVLSGLVASLVASLLSDRICFSAVPLSAIINLLPGLGLVLAMLELSSGNLICGAVRLVASLIVSFMLGWGIIVGNSLGLAMRGMSADDVDFENDTHCSDMTMWWWFLFVPLTTIGFCVWFKTHWRHWPVMIVAAAIGLVIQNYCNRVEVMRPLAPGIASFAVGLFSNIWSRIARTSTTADIIYIGIIQLVPGSTGVRSFISMLSTNSSASSLTSSMLVNSISIAVGLLLSSGAFVGEIKRFTHGTF